MCVGVSSRLYLVLEIFDRYMFIVDENDMFLKIVTDSYINIRKSLQIFFYVYPTITL